MSSDPPATAEGDAPGDPLEDLRDDRALMAAHLRGDARAFDTVFRRHRHRLWAVALRTIGNPEDAADALQDALLSAYRRADSYRGEAAVSTWLHRIVVNACLDMMRRRAVRPTTPITEDTEQVALRRDATDQSVTSLMVHEALATLPDDQRIAIVLVDLEGWSIDEAARVLDCAPGTVKSRCWRGRARLAPLLRDLRHEDPEGTS